MADHPAVRLEPLCAAHADVVFAELSDPELYRYLDDEPPPSIEWLERRFAALERGAPDGTGETWLNWVIVENDDTVLGTTQATVRADGPCSVAYVVFAVGQGRGVGRRATAVMLDELHTVHQVPEVQAEIDPANHRSIHLVESLGFTAAGTLGPDLRFVRRLPR